MSVHIKCDRCGATDDPHWRNLRVEIRRGEYGGTAAQEFTEPWNLRAHLCGYCASTLREWWAGDKKKKPS